MNRIAPVPFTLLLVILVPRCTAGDDVGLTAPDGFEVTLFADDDLAHDIFSLTIDSRGRVVVAGRGYVKILHDSDGDGRADKATLFSEYPKSGAHGMVFVGNDLLATGDNRLLRLVDKDGDGAADGKPQSLAIVNSPEHGANGLAIGPDGWIYLIGGNDAGIGKQLAATARSPVKQPQSGAVVRFSPDFKQSEVVAHGFRNPYDLAFNDKGHLFTVDADGERDQYLPWYTPNRLFDIQQGMHHGWVLKGWTRSWNRPASFFDNVDRLVEIGRGSPTGVLCYRHTQFPEKYQGGIFSCCWTLGHVYHFRLSRRGSTYESEKEIFLRTTGDVGFAPVDLAVGPDGDMLVAIGGRGTRGGLFRVRYVGDRRHEEEIADALTRVLGAPQPLSAWSRAKWVPAAKKLGREKLERAAANKKLPPGLRMRAIEILTELFGGLSDEALDLLLPRTYQLPVVSKLDPEVTARVVWSVSRSAKLDERIDRVASATLGGNAVVRRAAWEALAASTVEAKEMHTTPFWGDAAVAADRRVRSASLLAARRLESARFVDSKQSLAVYQIAMLRHKAAFGQLDAQDFRLALSLLGTPDNDWVRFADNRQNASQNPALIRRDAVRIMQLCLGDIRVEPTRPDVYAGYSAQAPDRVPQVVRRKAMDWVARIFPAQDQPLNRELARLAGMLEVDSERLAAKLARQPSSTSRVQDDIHYLIVLSRVGGQRSGETTKKTASALAFLHYKMLIDEYYPSRNWPTRLGEAFSELVRRDAQLPMAWVEDSAFRLPQQAMFAALLPAKAKQAAAEKLLAQSRSWGDDVSWPPELIRLVTVLPAEEFLPPLRAQWEDFAVRDTITRILAEKPRAEDRQRFVVGLASAEVDTIERSAGALIQLKTKGTPQEIAAALSALRQLCSSPRDKPQRQAVDRLLQVLTQQKFPLQESAEKPLLEIYRPWFDWFATHHPAAARKLTAATGDDVSAWLKRVEQIDWTAGDAARGKTAFARRSCARCHGERDRLGPELAGVSRRYSRIDLLREIVDPNFNVSPLYQTTRLETRGGRVYHGTLIYESPDGTLVQTGPDTTVRVAGEEIVSRTKSQQSLMPSGLLREATDQEVADLFAYLKTLTGP